MVTKKEIEIDYSFDVIEDVKLINQDAWIIIVSSDKKNWWSEKMIGWAKVVESPSTKYPENQSPEKMLSWLPCYSSNGYLATPENTQLYDIVYDVRPDGEDAKKVIQSESMYDLPCGEIKPDESSK